VVFGIVPATLGAELLGPAREAFTAGPKSRGSSLGQLAGPLPTSFAELPITERGKVPADTSRITAAAMTAEGSPSSATTVGWS
jgi:hypothetical protein